MGEYKIGDKVLMPSPQTARSYRDVMPNGEDIRSRTYGAHVAGRKHFSGRMDTEWFNRRGMENDCPICGAIAGVMCASIAKKPGKMAMVHQQRLPKDARKAFGR